MFAVKPWTVIVMRVSLIAVIVFNSLTPTPALAKIGDQQDEVSVLNPNPTGNKTSTDKSSVTSRSIMSALQNASTAGLSLTESVDTAGVKQEETKELLTLRADPGYVLSGANKFTLFWEVREDALKSNFTLRITLPEGVIPAGEGDVKFDEESRAVIVALESMSGELPLSVAELSADLLFYAALTADSGEIQFETKLFLPLKEKYVIEESGGIVTADEGRIKIEIPQDALAEDSSIVVGKPSGDSVPPFSLSDSPFEITAQGEASKEEQTQFSKEIMIRVSYADLEIPEELEGNLYLYWYNPDIKDWQALPTTVDRESKTIEGFTDHFTVFDINVNNWQSSRLPTVDSFQVSNFTGAATYSLPIEVPPGPGAFQPNLVLSYNSQIVDQSTTATQASWVGMGWSLDTGSIDLDSHGTSYDSDDTYLLNVAGVSTRLIEDSTGVYHSIDENFWRIQESANGGFEVWDKQGNIYYFQEGAPFPYQTGSCAGQNAEVEWETIPGR